MDTYNSILSTLKSQLQLNQELLIFSREKLEIIRTNDTTELMSISSQEEKLARKIIDLEKERGQLLTHLKNRGEDITSLTELVEKSSPALAQEIKDTAEALKNILQELQLQNEINDNLIQFTLEQIEIAKNYLMSDEAPTTYQAKKGRGGAYGAESTPSGKSLFEDKF